MSKKGVFGLTSVQAFFTIILAIALLAYVVIVIMGTLSQSTILTANPQTDRASAESIASSEAGAYLAQFTSHDAVICTVLSVNNGTQAGTKLSSLNYTVTNCLIANSAGGAGYNATTWSVNYTYTWSQSREQSKNVLSNTSSGISSFFGQISSVYAILAILVIILVLVVLVRVVTGGTGGGTIGSDGGRAMGSPEVI